MIRGKTLLQVLGIYAATSWVVLQVVDLLRENMGLPDWVFPFALVLLLIGLPVLLATAVVQSRVASSAEAARSGQIDVLIVNSTNPVFNLPDGAAFAAALDNIPLIVSLSSFLDETTAHADLILPSHTYLESWADDTPAPGVGATPSSSTAPSSQCRMKASSAMPTTAAGARATGGRTRACPT